MEKIKIAVIAGPTASGKTALAVRICRMLGGELVSGDSMQIYRGMDIGTAKPDPSELEGIPAHLIDVADPGDPFSAADFVRLAGRAVSEISARGKLPVLAGGTGLYIRTLLQGQTFPAPGEDPELRAKYSEIAAEMGGAELKRILLGYDPESAKRLHENDTKRLIRAIEVVETTGKPIGYWELAGREEESRYRAARVELAFEERAILYGRIDRRVDEMMGRGFLDEVSRLVDAGIDRNSTAMQAIGYRELAAHLDGEMGFSEAVELIKRNTRRYAKRQLTWLRGESIAEKYYVDKENFSDIAKKCAEYMEHNLNL